MNEAKVIEALRQSASGNEHRSQAARLRQIFEEVQRTLAAGLTRAGLLKVLKEHGFTFTYNSLGTAIYRIRKWQALRAQSSSTPEEITLTNHTPRPPIPTSVTTPAARKISNPADLAKARSRDINLKDYKS
jgi:hypothetical protein